MLYMMCADQTKCACELVLKYTINPPLQKFFTIPQTLFLTSHSEERGIFMNTIDLKTFCSVSDNC